MLPPGSALFPYTTLFRSDAEALKAEYQAKAKSADKDRKALIERAKHEAEEIVAKAKTDAEDRKSTRLNSSHGYISYAVFCLKKKKKRTNNTQRDTTPPSH